ncbi:MAG TPA: Type 1 glutamine amidotransferase-like domain-containing protein, partial [Thermoanaerobaculia bacterium]
MERALQPIYCLADSQLLFWREEGRAEPWLASLRDGLAGAAGEGRLRAAYVGASSGDEPAFYAIFQAAVEAVGIEDHRMILSSFQGEDREFLASADLVVLSGGDPVRGWRIFEQSGLQEAITRRYFEGAVLLGVSAGAVQLGWAVAPEVAPTEDRRETGSQPGDVTFTFRL